MLVNLTLGLMEVIDDSSDHTACFSIFSMGVVCI